MDRVMGVLGVAEITEKPEVLLCYLAFAVSMTIFVNWTLATLLVMLKPFTCAEISIFKLHFIPTEVEGSRLDSKTKTLLIVSAILLTIARPDIIQSLMQDENLKLFSEKMNNAFRVFFGILLKIGQQFRGKFS